MITNLKNGNINIIITDEPIYYLATDEKTEFATGYIDQGQVATGQPLLETYATIDDLNSRLAALGKPPYKDTIPRNITSQLPQDEVPDSPIP